jgi:hypothetical protein
VQRYSLLLRPIFPPAPHSSPSFAYFDARPPFVTVTIARKLCSSGALEVSCLE